MLIEVKNELSGRWLEWEAKSTDPNKPTFRGKMPNLILNQGLDKIGDPNVTIVNSCKLGTGTTAPAVTDTSLEAEVAAVTSGSLEQGTSGASPWYTYYRKTWTFPVGFVAGPTNLGEIGVGWSLTSTDTYSRALLLDGAGSPTVIPVDETYEFRAVYEHRVYPTLTDNVQDPVTDSGTSVNHEVTTRAQDVDSYAWWLAGVSQIPSTSNTRAYDGTIRSITEFPSGSSSSSSSVTKQTYTSGNYYLDFVLEWGSGNANFGTGISAISCATRSVLGAYQIGFNPAIMKDNTMKTELTLRFSWARKAI